MKVFISWSGTKSKKIAEIFRKWIPGVIQAVRPYFTPDDIAKGARWATEIAKELSESKIGIFILTAENLTAPWIIFEAGAISKHLDSARVCPLLFGVSTADVKGPLEQFQCSSFSKGEVKELLKSINLGLGDSALDAGVLESVFEMWWPQLEKDVATVLETEDTAGEEKPQRSEKDILEELLVLARRTYGSIGRGGISGPISAYAIEDLVTQYTLLVDILVRAATTTECLRILRDLGRPVRYFLRKEVRLGSDRMNELYSRLKEAFIKLPLFQVEDEHVENADESPREPTP